MEKEVHGTILSGSEIDSPGIGNWILNGYYIINWVRLLKLNGKKCRKTSGRVQTSFQRLT